MDLVLNDLGKLYVRNWIFKDLNYNIESGSSWGIRGGNGAGKSTLIHLLLGLHLPSKGTIAYSKNGNDVAKEEWGKLISFTAPYASVPLEFTALEFLNHSQKFRSLIDGISPENVLEYAFLSGETGKKLSEYSTGMLQRLKVALAICTQSELLIVDEPTSNLDTKGKNWFNEMLSRFRGNRTLIVASNESSDFEHCNHFIDLNVSSWD